MTSTAKSAVEAAERMFDYLPCDCDISGDTIAKCKYCSDFKIVVTALQSGAVGADVREIAIPALKRIAKWFGEFPETGSYWLDGDGEPDLSRPMSYGAANGSNGERDYMRGIAQKALVDIATHPNKERGQ